MDGSRLVVVDVEGNGAQPPEIIELAVLLVDDGMVGETREWLIKPVNPISPLVTRRVHGIRDTDVAACPSWADVADEVHDALRGRILLAHNASVERRVIAAHLPAWRPPLVLDTLRLARHVWPGLSGYGLDVLTEYAGVDTGTLPGARHRAMFDTWCVWHLFRVLAAGLDWSELKTVAALPESTSDNQVGLW